MAGFLPISTGSKYKKKWTPHFLTENFLEQNKELELEGYAQSPEKLKQHGMEISDLRKQFLKKAVEAVEEDGKEKQIDPACIKDQVKKIRERKSTKEPKHKWADCFDYAEPIAPGSRKKKAKRNGLSLQDKVRITCKILIDKELFKEVAKEFRTSPSIIHQLVKKVKDKPDLLQELVLKEKETALRG